MNIKRFFSHSITQLIFIFTIISLLMTGCQAISPVAETPIDTTNSVGISTPDPVEEILISEFKSITFDFSSVAKDHSIEKILAVSPNDNNPYWEIMPEHWVVTLQDYPIGNHMMKPQLFIYPVADLPMFNTGSATIASDLKSLLEDQEVDEFLPFLPMFNAAQVMHSQVEFFDFKNGSGVRFLTQFDQAPLPINNMELIYTFQGLTSDGKYYVAAVFPINHADLPDTNKVIAQDESDLKEFPSYLKETVAWLDQQSTGSFTPNLSELDALIQTIEVK
jgi:hypothetical protein